MTSPTGFRALFAAALAAFALAVAACGGSDGEHDGHDMGSGSGDGAAAQSASAAERGFLEAMVPHHESAIEMANIATERAEAPEIKALADAILAAQDREIEQMRGIHQRLFGSPLKPNEAGHEALGLSAEEAGMGHGEETMRMLEAADPFDRAFVDEMVPHHRGAIRMAEAVIDRTGDPEIKKLAGSIIAAQEQEIEQMNAFRKKKYGAPVPDEDAPGDGGHGAEGH